MAHPKRRHGRRGEGEDLRTRIERSTLLRLEAFLSRRPRGFVLLVGLLLVALIGLIDLVTGAFAVSIFYFVPIGLVTFVRGRWIGMLMSALSAIAWSVAEVAAKVTTVDGSITYWNALLRFYALAAVALLIAYMRDALVMSQELAARELEAADQLRALEELREALIHTELPTTVSVTADLEEWDGLAQA